MWALISAAASISATAKAAANLKVGVAAPALKVAKWVKGSPVAKFEPGKVYVVEFWATWCGPCKQSIPHLTELAKKFAGKVTFTGVSVWEDPQSAKTGSSAYMTKVADFVKNMGDKMAYNVAVDDPKGTVSDTWMRAAEQKGIPAAFVIDQQGKIAWIGHPMLGLDEVLPQVIAGKFDAAAAARVREEKEAESKRVESDVEKATSLVSSGKTDEGFKIFDDLVARHPEYKVGVAVTKFMALVKSDEPAAYKLAEKIGENEIKNDPMALNQVAWSIAEGKDLKSPDYAVATGLARRAVELTKSADPAILDTLGFALFKSGKTEEAIAVQEKAVAALSGNAQLPAEMKKEITERLEEFKKAKK
jgi:thiol-disulfide isomerase/thioredoxin